MLTLISVFSVCSFTFRKNILKILFLFDFLSKSTFFTPRGRVDNTPSALLRRGLGWDGLRYKSTASYVDAAHLWRPRESFRLIGIEITKIKELTDEN